MTAECQSPSHPFNVPRQEMALPFTCKKCERDFCAMCEGYFYETEEWACLCDGCESPEKQQRIHDFTPSAPVETAPAPSAPSPPPAPLEPTSEPVALADLSLTGTLSVLRTPSRLQQQFENGTDRAFRHRIIRALEMARARVSRGDPNLHTALHFACLHSRLDEEALTRFTALVKKAQNDHGAQPASFPMPRKGESSEDVDLRIAVKEAQGHEQKRTYWLPTCVRPTAGDGDKPPLPCACSPERPLSRAQAVCMLTLALLRAKTAPYRHTYGPLFQDDALPVVRK